MAAKHTPPVSPLAYPNKRTTTTSSFASTTISTAGPSSSSANTSAASSPSQETPSILYAIRKRSLPSPHQQQNHQGTETLGIYKCLEEANNTVYKLRLDYETCDPCFFWYGDGNGSPHPEDMEGPKGDCLSWEVFPDEDEAAKEGCRVWVERVEVDVWGRNGGGVVEWGGAKSDGRHNWRAALEPIARPCDFWGTFRIKG